MLYIPSLTVLTRQELDLEGPTTPAPNGSISILDNPPNSNNIAIAIITVCVVFSAIFYLARFYFVGSFSDMQCRCMYPISCTNTVYESAYLYLH